jgi:hypothetical protein
MFSMGQVPATKAALAGRHPGFMFGSRKGSHIPREWGDTMLLYAIQAFLCSLGGIV